MVKALARKLGLSTRRIIDLNSKVFEGLDEVHKFTVGSRVWVESHGEGSDGYCLMLSDGLCPLPQSIKNRFHRGIRQ